ncbi:MAG TPA: hypothetical protein ENI87_03520 [bacterium]|nr:hypothetical protein [bacterium]
MVQLPLEATDDLVPFAPVARRELPLFGATVELVLVPARRARPGRVRAERPAFSPSPAERIVGEEACWQADGLALTPNRYPFARDQRILWRTEAAREPDRAFWRAALRWARDSGGSVLLNNIGAAATIARAHAHLVGERAAFLADLPERAFRSAPIDVPDGCELLVKRLPFCLVGARGDIDAVAAALLRLADARMTATWNVVVAGDTAWVAPRRIETPTPHFPQALGSAELWGRWCYVDEEPFARATSNDLERALLAATMPAIDGA